MGQMNNTRLCRDWPISGPNAGMKDAHIAVRKRGLGKPIPVESRSPAKGTSTALAFDRLVEYRFEDGL